MIEEEELRCNDGKGSWRRRGTSIKDRRLMNVNSKTLFKNGKDFLRFLPNYLMVILLAKLMETPLSFANSLFVNGSYCLRKMGAITPTGKKGKELIFKVS